MKHPVTNILCRVLTLLFLLHGVASPSAAQLATAGCLEEVRAVLQHLNIPTRSGNNAYFMKVTSVTILKDSSSKPVSTTMEMLVKGDVLRVRSSDMEVYQDDKHIVVISPKEKSILIRKYAPVESQKQAMEKILFLQDTILQSCVVKDCRDLLWEGKRAREVTLNVRSTHRQAFPFYSMTLVLDPNEHVLKKAVVYYNPLQPIRSVSMVYHTVNYNYPVPKDIAKPALSFVLDEKNIVLARYRGYRILDVR